jgi:hypothetical protein
MKALSISVIGVVLLLSTSESTLAQSSQQSTLSPIKIMQYNVQNLFDAEHDRGKEDYEFLPKNHNQKEGCQSADPKSVCRSTDWTTFKLNLKLRQLKRVIDAQGTLPDVLVVEEVENEYVVGRLTSTLGFDSFVMTNSPDKRGIDVAILYREDRLRFINHLVRRMDLNFDTRDLIVANFEAPGGEVLGIFGNHWPSQLNPDDKVRMAVAEEVRTFVDDASLKYGDRYHVILTGDFNTTETAKPDPFKEVILKKDWAFKFTNVRKLYQQAGGRDYPGGTFYYPRDKQWNEFDIFFASSNLTDGQGLDVMPESYKLNMPEFATKTVSSAAQLEAGLKDVLGGKAFRIPMRYDVNSTDERTAGYSDHFGIVLKLRTSNSYRE